MSSIIAHGRGRPIGGTSRRDMGETAAVTDRRRSALNLNVLLAAVEAAPPVAAADVVGEALSDALDARDVSFLIADYSGRSLIRLSHVDRAAAPTADGRERSDAVPLTGTPHGRALAEQQVQVLTEHGGSRLFAPVTSRGEAVGVLELALDGVPDERTVAGVALAAHALAYVVIANRRFTDLYEWGQRSLPLSLEAEVQHRLLPTAYTLEAGQFTIAGWLEPAGDVGGDTFDFSLERDTLHVSMTDAMGHTLSAALLATVLVGALRNARRRAVGLAEQASLAHEALSGYAGEEEFVTGQLVRIDLLSGTGRIVNAGHPAPIRVRERSCRACAPGCRPALRHLAHRGLPRPGARAARRRPARLPHGRDARAERHLDRRNVDPGRQFDTCTPAKRSRT